MNNEQKIKKIKNNGQNFNFWVYRCQKVNAKFENISDIYDETFFACLTGF